MAVEALRRARPSVRRGNLQEQLHSKDAALVRAPIPSCGFVTLTLKGRQEAGTRTPVLFALAGRGEGALSSRVALAVSGSRIRSSWPAPGHGLAALSRRRAHPGGAGGGPAGSAWRRHGSSAAREQWLFSCAIEQKLALSEQPAVIRADLQVGVKRALKIS